MSLRLLIIVVLLTLIGCASTPKTAKTQIKKTLLPLPPIHASLLNNNFNAVESYQDVFTLTLEQQNDFFDFYHSSVNQSLTDLERIYAYLEKRMGNYNFYSETMVAKDVIDKNSGNCLSLAIVTKSLADLLGIKTRFELVETPTIFQKQDNVILNYRHVRSVLYSDSQFMRVDYFPSRGTRTLRRVADAEFYAMFYNNKAVDAILNYDYKLTIAYLNESLRLFPANAEAINMMGVLHSRLGLFDEAEKLYQFGLSYSNEIEILLKNYQSLLVRLNRTDEANAIALKLENFSNINPFSWIKLADDAYQDKDYKLAIAYYKKAVKIASYLHEPYAGIALSKYQLGKLNAASNSIIKAIANSHKEDITRRYQSKYEYFQTMSHAD